jgi:hypothetical protein
VRSPRPRRNLRLCTFGHAQLPAGLPSEPLTAAPGGEVNQRMHARSEDQPARSEASAGPDARRRQNPRAAAPLSPDGLAGLQRSAGNRAVGMLIEGSRARSAVQRQPPLVPAAGSGLHAIVVEHRQLTDDWQQVQQTVERAIEEDGWEKTHSWAYRFINADTTGDAFTGNAELVAGARQRLRSEMEIKRNSLTQLLGPVEDMGDVVIGGAGFEGQATQLTRTILDNSERQVKAEASRYGLEVEGLVFKEYSMTAGGPVQAGLQEAARTLAAKRSECDGAANAFLRAQTTAQDDVRRNPFLPSQDLLDGQEAARRAWVDLEDAYHQMAVDRQRDYPILAAFTTVDDAAQKLRELGSQDSTHLAETLYKTVDDRLKNIQTVRDEIGVRYSIWKQPQIVALTKRQMSLAPWQSRVVDEKAQKVHADAQADAEVWGAVALGLGLLAAIPTGGTSLLAGVAAAAGTLGAVYSLHTLYEHYKEYELASAETGTDVDKANAIAQEEPSLLWLAFDLLDLGLNVAGAMAAFKALRGAMQVAEASRLERLPEVIQAAERAGLTAEGKARFISYVIERCGGAKTVDELLQSILDTYSRLQPAGDAALADAYKAAATKIVSEGRVGFYRPGALHRWTGATLDELKRVLASAGLGEPELTQSARSLARRFEATPAMMGGYLQGVDIVILREGTSMEEFLAHELAHRAQWVTTNIYTMGTMRKEYQAFVAQRQFLLHLPVEKIPSTSHWLLFATDADIEAHVTSAYASQLALDPPFLSPLDPRADANLILKAFKDLTKAGRL